MSTVQVVQRRRRRDDNELLQTTKLVFPLLLTEPIAT